MLKRALLASNATWKVVAGDMPLGLLIPDVNGFEAWANGDMVWRWVASWNWPV